MSDTTPRPDRADDSDFDVPTYTGTTAANASPTDATPAPNPEVSRGPSLYERAGRAAPQEIHPRSSATEGTTAFPAASALAASAPAPAPQPAAPAYSSTPNDYRDEDFAPAPASAGASAPTPEPTTVAPAVTNTAVPTYVQEPLNDAHPNDIPEDDSYDRRRGTIDFGVLLARLVLGGWLILESIGTFFQLGGAGGLSGLESDFTAYPLAGVLAIVVPTMQLSAGVFLLVGLVTPLAAAVATVATGFMALHGLAAEGAGFNLFTWSDSIWLAIVLLGLSVVLQFTGPGYYSIDGRRSWARRPLASSWIFVVVALVALGLLWWFGTAINPFA